MWDAPAFGQDTAVLPPGMTPLWVEGRPAEQPRGPSAGPKPVWALRRGQIPGLCPGSNLPAPSLLPGQHLCFTGGQDPRATLGAGAGDRATIGTCR